MRREVVLRRLATLAWLLSIVVWAGFAAVAFLNRDRSGGSPILEIAEAFSFVILGTFGYLIVRRQPTNLLGWQAMTPGLAFPVEWFASELAAYRVLTVGLSDPIAQAAGWVALWAWIPAAFSAAYLFLLFPDGQVPSRRWRPVLRLFVTIMTLIFVTAALAPGPVDEESTPGLMNPLGIESLATFFSFLAAVVFPLFPLAVVVAVISLFVRYRNSGPVVRAQIKWLALAGIVAIPYFARPPEMAPGLNSLLNIAFSFVVGAAILIPVLKYRLYEIDRLISRTVTYALVAVVLAGVYLVVVVVLGSQLGQDNSLAVAGSTLATAAIFSPVRKRVQALVERRFDRARYNAQVVVDDFSGRLRDEVDLETLVTDLSGVVNGTMRPSNLSLWLAN